MEPWRLDVLPVVLTADSIPLSLVLPRSAVETTLFSTLLVTQRGREEIPISKLGVSGLVIKPRAARAWD